MQAKVRNLHGQIIANQIVTAVHKTKCITLILYHICNKCPVKNAIESSEPPFSAVATVATIDDDNDGYCYYYQVSCRV